MPSGKALHRVRDGLPDLVPQAMSALIAGGRDLVFE
jgi:hypothetical protein